MRRWRIVASLCWLLPGCAVLPPAKLPPHDSGKPPPARHTNDLVLQTQIILIALHYLPQLSDADGRNGPRTRRAIIAAEQVNGLRDDGLVSWRLLHRLRAASAVAAPQGQTMDRPAPARTPWAAPPLTLVWVEPLPAARIAGLDQPPVTLAAPVVQDTATLTDHQGRFVLQGVRGLIGFYATQLQAYINRHGGPVACAPTATGRFVCTTPETIDLAEVALVNGAAMITLDAPDAYVAQQTDAIIHHRGIWATQTDEYATPQRADPCGVTPCQAAQAALP